MTLQTIIDMVDGVMEKECSSVVARLMEAPAIVSLSAVIAVLQMYCGMLSERARKEFLDTIPSIIAQGNPEGQPARKTCQ